MDFTTYIFYSIFGRQFTNVVKTAIAICFDILEFMLIFVPYPKLYFLTSVIFLPVSNQTVIVLIFVSLE
jgi:hypothetical protein